MASKQENRIERENASQFPLGKRNFLLMGASALLIVLGFLLMLGGSSTEAQFNPDIFSTRRIVVGPTIAFIGFIALGFSIILRPGGKKAGK